MVRHGTTWQDEAGPGEANKKGLLPPFCFMWPRPRNRIVVSHRTATAFAIRNPAAPALPRQCISAFGILRPSAPAVSRARSRAAAPRLSSSDRSRSQIARNASAVALFSRLGGSVSSQSRYSPCNSTSSATASRHLCGRLRRSAGLRYLTRGAHAACAPRKRACRSATVIALSPSGFLPRLMALSLITLRNGLS